MNTLEVRESLLTLLPNRRKQWGTLLSLLGGGGLVPSNIFLYGLTATGKTHVLKTTLEQLQLSFVHINCVECDTTSLLVAPIAAKISDIYLRDCNSKKCTTLMDLIEVMKKAAKSPENKETPFIIALERSDRLRHLPPNTLPALLKLQELSRMNVCVIMLSEIIWEKFYCKSWFCKPIKIFFPQYNKEETYQILAMRRPEDTSEQFYNMYLKIIINVLFRFCRDLNELHYMAQQHLHLLPENVKENLDVKALWQKLNPHLKSSIKQVHLRKGIRKQGPSSKDNPLSALTCLVSGMELPYYAKYLLIAAFLASFNASKHDRRLFMKFHGKEKKRLLTKNQKHQVKMSSLLVGPKPFNFERLSAIFHAIAEIKYTLSTNLCAQLTSLVNLKLISRVGSAGLNDPKYKCAVGLDFISSVGESVQFNVSRYVMEK